MTQHACTQAGGARPTLFGKLPWASDYVRIHHTHPATIAFDAWLQASAQQLARSQTAWPSAVLRFVLTPPGAATRLAGVLAPSRDRAGRRFPVAVLQPLPPLSEASALAFPRWLAPFFDDAVALLARAEALGQAGTHAALDALAAPSLGALVDARRQVRAVASESALSAFAAELGADAGVRPDAASLAHALADQQRASAVLHRPAIWRCPARTVAHAEGWLSLHAAHAAPAEPPSWCWAQADAALGLWLVSGPLPAALLGWLARPALAGDRVALLGPAPV